MTFQDDRARTEINEIHGLELIWVWSIFICRHRKKEEQRRRRKIDDKSTLINIGRLSYWVIKLGIWLRRCLDDWLLEFQWLQLLAR
jgi:hypothetical protein